MFVQCQVGSSPGDKEETQGRALLSVFERSVDTWWVILYWKVHDVNRHVCGLCRDWRAKRKSVLHETLHSTWNPSQHICKGNSMWMNPVLGALMLFHEARWPKLLVAGSWTMRGACRVLPPTPCRWLVWFLKLWLQLRSAGVQPHIQGRLWSATALFGWLEFSWLLISSHIHKNKWDTLCGPKRKGAFEMFWFLSPNLSVLSSKHLRLMFLAHLPKLDLKLREKCPVKWNHFLSLCLTGILKVGPKQFKIILDLQIRSSP